jgi:hypothetical protein
MRNAAVVLAVVGFVLGCSDAATAPKPDQRSTVAHLINRQATAQGLAHIGNELWFVQASRESTADIGGTATQLQFQRQDWLTGARLENVQVQIPDADFTVGGRTQDWSLHTTLAGHGAINLTFLNSGAWQKARFPLDTLPGGIIFRVRGNIVTLSNLYGLDGSIFGASVGTGTDWRLTNLLLADDAVLGRTTP